MNPFDLPGPAFLAFFLMSFAVVVTFAIILRRGGRLPDDDPPREIFDLDRYEIAYLSGKESLAVNAAIASLVYNGHLSVSKASNKISASINPPSQAHPLEEAVYRSAGSGEGSGVKEIRQGAEPACALLSARPREMGLICQGSDALVARWLPMLLVLSVTMLGVIKIIVGIERGKPVGFLVILCVISLIVALVGFARGLHRSRRGDRALAQLQEANAVLQLAGTRSSAMLKADELALSVGLFGLGMLAGSPLADLQKMLTPPSGSGGGCGGGGCGGGGCGGGCGGCGG